ncbi:putative disease resistance protein RGA3 isoform X10 [Malus sylvestris]|uniref:putative disease resistance protein RGA3 isoform X10 n=1 Tax=Malus sylvestris TaxID=3752 RepID=UPI0021ACB0EC|nr:putative disease resistance protein RGA3 isoform X10 [Malus sylvestris]
MAEGVLFNIAEGIIGTLQNHAIQEIGLLYGVKDELKKLEKTVTKIKNVLLDAEEKKANHEVTEWLKSLEDVVYDADDLLDEFYTEARWRQMVIGNKISKQVRLFFSSSNQLVFRLKMGHKIKEIRETLNVIETDRRFHLDERLQEARVLTRERESHSFVRKEEIIGRDRDKREIVQLMLDPIPKENVSIISLVGIGGLGKTALAQLVFNDETVQKHFELKIWICISDTFELNVLVKKIIESATSRTLGNLELDQLQNDLRKLIDGKRYLLVLDDVWNENREKWLSLKSLLMGGARGSRILITTRSEVVAKISDTNKPYILRGLEEKESWSLFKQMAFKTEQESENPSIKAIGVEIVGKCKGIPLAIRTIGRMLYSKNRENEWLAFKNNDLSKVNQEASDILPTLRLSYDILPSHLKHCFAYCSLFPKDHEIDIKTLVNLWVAQGFVKSLDQNKSLEDVGYEYFFELAWRSFFQEVTYDEFGMIRSCKMHDLMHDLAKSVSGMEITIVVEEEDNFSEKLRHVSFDYSIDRWSSKKNPTSLLKAHKLRTFFFISKYWYGLSDESEYGSIKSFCNAIASNFKLLRMLSMNELGVRTLPNSLRKLRHLRYLDLRGNPIERLPKWIVRLQNLQTLNLSDCHKLVELPRDINKLFNLRHLMVFRCISLNHMPYGLGELACLRTLDRFVLSEDGCISRGGAGLGVLNRLNNLTGNMSIENLWNGKDMVSEAISANMKEKQSLTSLSLRWKVNTTGWLSSLTNIVNLSLEDCKTYASSSASRIPFFPSLKEIYIVNCPNLKGWWKQSALIGSPMTEYERQHIQQSSLSFPCLSLLDVWKCPNLTSMPLYPHLEEELFLDNTSLKPLEETMMIGDEDILAPAETTSSACTCCSLFSIFSPLDSGASDPHVSASSSSPLSKLISLAIEGIEDIECVPERWLRNLTSLRKLRLSKCRRLRGIPLSPSPSVQHLTALDCLEIMNCNELDLWKEDESFLQWKSLKSLRTLRISSCDRLIKLPEGIGNLTSLSQLVIGRCPNLASLPEGMCRLTSLETLIIYSCDRLIKLPEGIVTLTSLHQLVIEDCPNLASLPEGMCRLTSLETLRIRDCSSLLSQRYEKERGEDWSKIAHIPNISIF